MFWKNHSYHFVRFFLNQVAIGLFGAVLYFAASKAGNSDLKLVFSIASVLFFLFMEYTTAWEIGAKDHTPVAAGRKTAQPYLGVVLAAVAHIPTFLAGVFMALDSCIDQTIINGIGTGAALVNLFLDGMYLGTISYGLSDGQQVWIYWYLLLVLPGIAVSGVGYYLGMKGIRLTPLNAVQYPKSDRPTRAEMRDRKKEEAVKHVIKPAQETYCYHVPKYANEGQVSWDTVPKVALHYQWLGNGYEPQTVCQMAMIEHEGLIVRMTCKESNPRAEESGVDGNSYLDSCMEFFAQYVACDDRYVNIEMNSTDSVLSAIGPDRFHRDPVYGIIGKSWNVQHDNRDDEWTVLLHIPFADISSLYGIDAEKLFVPGYRFKGNFYKCGDACEIQHYGMWTPIPLEKPDFHCPPYFGIFMID